MVDEGLSKVYVEHFVDAIWGSRPNCARDREYFE